VTRAVTVREPEYNDRDRAHLLADWDAESEPRNDLGVLMSDATNPKYNPYAVDAEGSFEAEPTVDFSRAAVHRVLEARRKLIKEEDDWPLLWKVRLKRSEPAVGDGDDA